MARILGRINWKEEQATAEILKLLEAQLAFIYSDADIAITGGSAGGGKTVSILGLFLERGFLDNPRFRATILRRLYPQITKPGGLFDEAQRWFKSTGCKVNRSSLEFIFSSGAKVGFESMQHEKDRFKMQGRNVDVIAYEELTHFTEQQFWYPYSRVRSTSGKTLVRASCNADADSWVKGLIDWWIDPLTGYAILERSGIKRYLCRIDDITYWGDTAEELIERFPGEIPTSLAFFPSYLEDNPILLEADPSYKGKLQAQSKVERERLLKGNWLIRSSETQLFDISLIPDAAIGNWQGRTYGHTYLVGVDPNFGAIGNDYFCAQCWDVTLSPYVLCKEFRTNSHSTTYSVKKVAEMISEFNPLIVAVEKDGGGQIVLEQLIDRCPDANIKPVSQGSSSTAKIIATDRIALALESGSVIFPTEWTGIPEMYSFSKMSRKAASGNDDSVLAWAIAFSYLPEVIELMKEVSPFLV